MNMLTRSSERIFNPMRYTGNRFSTDDVLSNRQKL